MIELSKDDMKCIEEFESQTGAAVVDEAVLQSYLKR